MAFAGTTDWDVRTTGNDLNGGAWDTASTGTDYSQQDAPQVTYTDLVIGATNTQLTSAAFPFTGPHVGNVINITGGTGFTVGRYQVVSVAGNVATMDRAVGTASSTGGAGRLGGALALPLTAINASWDKNTVHIKWGTYTQSANGTFTVPNNNGPLYIIGYGSAHNDNGTRPLLTTATNNITIWQMGLQSNTMTFVRNINFSSTAGTPGHGLQATGQAGLAVINCTISGFKVGINGDNSTYVNTFVVGLWVIASEVHHCTSDAVINNAPVYVSNSYIHDNAGVGVVYASNGSSHVVRSIIVKNAKGVGSWQNGAGGGGGTQLLTILSSTIANNTGDGIVTTGANSFGAFTLLDNIIWGNGGFGVNLTAANAAKPAFADYNAFGNNTGGNRNRVPVGAHDVSLTVNPFTNDASGDYTLNNIASGGALCRGAAL